ncbi:MAG: outer membrane protein assembly factor BamD [Myxococcota bacterium]
MFTRLVPTLLALWLITGCTPLRGTPGRSAVSAPTVQEQYDLGVRYMKRGYYTRAIEQFNRIRNYYRDDPFSVKSELAIADVYYRKNEWDQARLAYDDFMRLHPRHPDLDYVIYRIGLTLYKKAPRISARDQTWTRQAVNTWSGFEGRFPESEHQPDVQEKLRECRERLAHKELIIARFYANPQRKAWSAVLGRVDGLLRTYPNSDYVPEALELKVVAHAWQGEMAMARATLDRLRTVDDEVARRAARKFDNISL